MTQFFINFLKIVWLTAIIVGGIFAVPIEVVRSTPEGMVYCPLSKQYQPQSPRISKPESIDLRADFCTGTSDKKTLADEISGSLRLSVTQKLNRQQLEEIVFSYLQGKGKEAVNDLPLPQQEPEQNRLFTASFATPLVRFNNDNVPLVAATGSAFCYSLNSRPPTKNTALPIFHSSVNCLKGISRNINPRSPPVT